MSSAQFENFLGLPTLSTETVNFYKHLARSLKPKKVSESFARFTPVLQTCRSVLLGGRSSAHRNCVLL